MQSLDDKLLREREKGERVRGSDPACGSGSKMLKNKSLGRLSGAILLVLALGMAAQADPIGPVCGTCQGSIYELLNLGSVVDGTTDILYRIDTSGYTGTGTYIDSVGIKVLSSMTGTLLVSAPGGVVNWNIVGGSLNAGGCEDNPGDAFACAQDAVATGGFAPVGGILEWVFRVPAISGFLDPSSIKARYVDDNDNKVGDLLSEDITLQRIPEPASLFLLASGMLGLASVFRRRLRKTSE